VFDGEAFALVPISEPRLRGSKASWSETDFLGSEELDQKLHEALERFGSVSFASEVRVSHADEVEPPDLIGSWLATDGDGALDFGRPPFVVDDPSSDPDPGCAGLLNVAKRQGWMLPGGSQRLLSACAALAGGSAGWGPWGSNFPFCVLIPRVGC